MAHSSCCSGRVSVSLKFLLWQRSGKHLKHLLQKLFMEANLQPGINRYWQNWRESARNLLWWLIYNFTLADKTKLSCNTPQQCSTTISYNFFLSFICLKHNWQPCKCTLMHLSLNGMYIVKWCRDRQSQRHWIEKLHSLIMITRLT